MDSNRIEIIAGHNADQFFICELVKNGYLIIDVYYSIEKAKNRLREIYKKRGIK